MLFIAFLLFIFACKLLDVACFYVLTKNGLTNNEVLNATK